LSAPASVGGGARLAHSIDSAQLFTVAFGCVVGVAWMIVLGDIVALAGPGGAALAMGVGGVAILLVAFCYAEVAAVRPAAGGELVYAYDLGGPGACFAVGWILVLLYLAACAFEAISIGAVTDLLFPGVVGPRLYRFLSQDVRLGAVLIGFAGVLGFWGLNAAGAGMTARAQQWVTYVRILLMVVFLGAALAYAKPANLLPPFSHGPGGTAAGGFLAALATAPFWFGGFTTFATASEETASSMRIVGRAIVVSVIAAAVFYVVLILAVSALAPWRSLSRMQLPAAQAFEVGMGSPTMAKVVLVTALLGNLTAWNALLLAGSRVVFALGRARLGPTALGEVHRRFKTPAAAIAAVSLVSIAALFLGRGFILPLVNVASACFGVLYAVTCLTLIKLRREPGARPAAYAAPGGVVTAWIAAIASLAMVCVALIGPWLAAGPKPPSEWLTLGGWIALGVLIWTVTGRSRASIPQAERAALLRGGALGG